MVNGSGAGVQPIKSKAISNEIDRIISHPFLKSQPGAGRLTLLYLLPRWATYSIRYPGWFYFVRLSELSRLVPCL